MQSSLAHSSTTARANAARSAELPVISVSQSAPCFSDHAVEGAVRMRLHSLKGKDSKPKTRQPPASLGMA
eukprot:825423-Pyramimonas_sp.AAC.1